MTLRIRWRSPGNSSDTTTATLTIWDERMEVIKEKKSMIFWSYIDNYRLHYHRTNQLRILSTWVASNLLGIRILASASCCSAHNVIVFNRVKFTHDSLCSVLFFHWIQNGKKCHKYGVHELVMPKLKLLKTIPWNSLITQFFFVLSRKLPLVTYG